jgi:hypothetical protein
VRLRSIIKVLLLPNWAVNERIRLTNLLNATNGKLVNAENHIKELTDVRVSLQDRLAELTDERQRLREILEGFDTVQFVAPGHFYSPFPSKRDLEEHLSHPRSLLRDLPAVHVDDPAQLEMLKRLQTYYPLVPFKKRTVERGLYPVENPNYPYADAVLLFCMLNYIRPRRLIEIGSGFSTCAILDTNRLSPELQIQVTSIDPDAALLRSLIGESRDRLTIIERKVQDVDLEVIDQLDAGDVLFIDSSHVSKLDSDVNYIFFEILPRLKSRVVIHLHDIYAGFEYPDEWLKEGRAWNEAYLLRTFLEYNERFRILLFFDYMQNAHQAWFQRNMPDLAEGSCFWMEKV